MTPGKSMTPSLIGLANRATRLPLLIDICLTISQIVVLVVAVVTAVLSILAGVDALTVVLRTAAAMLCVGLPLYVLNYLFGRFYVKAALEEMGKTGQEMKTSSDSTDGKESAEPEELEVQA